MNLLDILEPAKSTHKNKDEIAIGIDLGTTNSLAAICIGDEFKLLGGIIPSRVRKVADHVVIDYENNLDSLISIKRFMGKTCEKFDGFDMNPEEISAIILKNVINQAEKQLSCKIYKAVITVPAYFDDAARQATLRAAKIANIEVLRLINEPTAAALAYGLNNYKEGFYGVYDFGGGTFDSTILQMKMGVFKVLATCGDNELGGDDIDDLLVRNFLDKNTVKDKISSQEYLELKDQMRQIKESLSTKDQVEVNVRFSDQKYYFKINRAAFKNLSNELLVKTYKIFSQALADSKCSIDELEGIIMVGGSSRVSFIKDHFIELVGEERIFDKHDPEKVVAQGAAVQARNLVNPQGHLLIDVVPLSLALETYGGLCEKLILKNTSIPISVKKTFTTYADGQTGMIFNIVQGEREFAKDCRSLAKLELKGIPPMKSGLAKIEVEFKVDTDGVLTVSAQELSSGKSISIEVNPTYGISGEEVMDMVLSSYQNAHEDIKLRKEKELILNTQDIVRSFEKALNDYPDIVSQEELNEIAIKITFLKDAISNNDIKMLEDNIENIESLSEDFASRQLSKYLSKEIKGKSIDYVKEKFLKE
jgi:molecular chaperone HscA